MKRSFSYGVVVTAGILVALIVVCGAGAAALRVRQAGAMGKVQAGTTAGHQAPVIDVAVVAEQAPQIAFTRRGVLEPSEQISIYAEASGRVVQRHRAAGDRVEQDDPILELDGALLRIRLDEAVARRDSAQIQLDQAVALLADAEASEDEDVRRDAKSRRDAAQAALDLAEAQLAEAQKLYDARIVRAPTAGTLAQSFVDRGELAASGRPVAEMIVTDPIKAVVALTAEETRLVETATACDVQLTLRDGTQRPAKLVRIAPVADPRTRRFTVALHAGNPDGRMRAGMRVSVSFRCQSDEPSLRLPRRALMRRDDRLVCFRVRKTDDGHVAEQVEPQWERIPGAGRSLRVVSGFRVGDQVAVSGHLMLSDGAAIRPQPWQRADR